MKTIELFQAENGAIEFRGDNKHETIWASQKQIAELFTIDRTVVSRHIKNIFKDDELDKKVVCAKFAHTTSHGALKEKTQTREIEFYNLDIILAIGYRTSSKKAIDFRKWASSVLKKYLLNGYAINEKKLTQTKNLLNNLKATIELLSTKEIGQEKEILSLLKTYTKTLSLLESYDKSSIKDFDGNSTSYHLTYSKVKSVLKSLKSELIKKGEATQLFANEKADELDGIIGNLYQTFGGVELYPSIEDKASHLLYFIIKDHPFNDGNKRSASFLFIYFLDRCDYLYKSNGEKKINENALTTLTLLVASSNPNEKEILVKLIKHLIFEAEL
ncbi:MAG: virulence protein RhuM/Fic/DOC family protein [Sulfurimonas sp.]|nr:virulence protein RhuM/Fic/DOC family protein [Sulfurimonas sp.]